MKKKSLRILSLIVAIVMVVAMLPLSALAEELGPKRQVGVVVYGSEITEILTDIESSADHLKQGDLNIQGNLESLQELVTDLGTKVADGSGISVPDVDVELVSESGKEYKLKEDTSIEIFTETTDVYLPFQAEVEKQIKSITDQLDVLQEELQGSTLGDVMNGISTAKQKLEDLLKQLESFVGNIVAAMAKFTGLNGTFYRTYVTPDQVPVGDYTVKVKGFTDTDSDGRAMTREGYVLYNDGLGAEGSGYNTERSFDVKVVEKDDKMFERDIQFVGPENGIAGKLDIPAPFATIYDGVVSAMNFLNNTLGDLTNKVSGVAADALSWIGLGQTSIAKLLRWLSEWNSPNLSKTSDLDLSYKFLFPGLWCAESDAGFSFTDVDVAETGISGSEYLLVNRDEVVNVLKFMTDLGKDTFKAALKATFGGTVTYADGTVKTYDSIAKMYLELVKSKNGQLSLDYDTAFAILKTYVGVISDMKLFDRVVEPTDNLLTPYKLKNPIPGFLLATSDEKGVVTFNRNNNITLTWMLKIIPSILDKVGNTSLVKDNKVLNLLIQLSDYAAKFVDKYGTKIINTLVYPFAQRLGLVGKKMASGKYLMFQTKAGDGYWINPLAYTMVLTWENETWLYVTVADLGIVMPYFAADFYDFVRNTTFAGTIDNFLSKITGKEVNVISDILTDKIDMTKELNQTVMGALTAFVGTVGFKSLGMDSIFNSKSDFTSGLNKYLYENGRTAQNLMIYLNRQAMKAKSVYAGYVDTNWYFYNLNKSPTITATKLIDKSTKDIAAAFVNPTKSGIVTKTGNTVSKVINTIGSRIEKTAQAIRTKIKSTIGATLSSVVKKTLQHVKSTITSFFKNMFSRLFHA